MNNQPIDIDYLYVFRDNPFPIQIEFDAPELIIAPVNVELWSNKQFFALIPHEIIDGTIISFETTPEQHAQIKNAKIYIKFGGNTAFSFPILVTLDGAVANPRTRTISAPSIGTVRVTSYSDLVAVAEAKGYRNEALVYRNEARAAADSTNVDFPRYDTVEEGMAEVSIGDSFSVTGTGDVAVFVYKKTGTTTYDLVTSYPSSLAIEQVREVVKYTEDQIFYVSDNQGNFIFQATGDGIDYVGKTGLLDDVSKGIAAQTGVNEIKENLKTSEDDEFSVSDLNGNKIFQAGSSGVNYIGKVDGESIRYILPGTDTKFQVADPYGNVTVEVSSEGLKFAGQYPEVPGNFDADYNLHIGYGQSLSVQGGNLAATDFYDSLTFQGGLFADIDPDNPTEVTAYFGTDFVPLPTDSLSDAKDIGKYFVKMIKDFVVSENHIPLDKQEYTWITANPGEVGASWAALSDQSGIFYRRLMLLVTKGKEFAMTRGKTFAVPVISWIQGESSSDNQDTVTAYYNKLVTLFTNLNSDIKAVTGQTRDIQFIIYQTASFLRNGSAKVDVSLAQLKAATDITNVHLGTAMYQLVYSDGIHLQSASYRTMWATMGRVAKAAVVDKKKWKHIQPISHSVQVNAAATVWVINIPFEVPVKPLVFDQTIDYGFDTAPTNYGFSILNGVTEIITEAKISRGDTIVLKCNQNPAGKTLTYAIGGASKGGNLRDSQGDKTKTIYGALSDRVDNWCPIFTIII